MFKTAIPAPVHFIMQELCNAGHEAYIVGGCVRDGILGIEPHDWDICTSATPNQVMDSFPDEKIIPTGLKHGTISIVINSVPFEVTTFRIDGNYSDGRHPDLVEFTSDLMEDLKRRDFTINAMAYGLHLSLIHI